jgi:hypothetical protein
MPTSASPLVHAPLRSIRASAGISANAARRLDRGSTLMTLDGMK